MASRPELISFSDAAAVIAAVDFVASSHGSTADRIGHMLQALQRLLGRDSACTIALLDRPEEEHAEPRLLKRYYVGWPLGVPQAQQAEQEELRRQAVWPIIRDVLIEAIAQPQVARTFVASERLGLEAWRATPLLVEILQPVGYDDAIFSFRASAEGRVVGSVIYHAQDTPAFDGRDVQLTTLLIEAMAPMIDREVFQGHPAMSRHPLTERQNEVLHLLLTGDSERQIAVRLHRSVHTVHTYIKQIYEIYQVSSRGELMAQFIDRRVLPSEYRAAIGQ